MTFQHRMLAALALLAGLAGAALPGSARAAQSYDSCTGFIDALPATISTQGTWCLRGHLSTAITIGNAITIAANNVTLDCNEFRVGGLAAGNASMARGIWAEYRQNITVRNCNVRGFNHGIWISHGAGHLIEDNRLDNNLNIGISVQRVDNSLVQRNRVYDTGGRAGHRYTYGIIGSADVVDNTVSGLFVDTVAGPEPSGMEAIYLYQADGAQVRDNSVSGFDMTAVQGGNVGRAYGIRVFNSIQVRISGNQLAGGVRDSDGGLSDINGWPIQTNSGSHYCLHNTVGGFSTDISNNCIRSGNLTP